MGVRNETTTSTDRRRTDLGRQARSEPTDERSGRKSNRINPAPGPRTEAPVGVAAGSARMLPSRSGHGPVLLPSPEEAVSTPVRAAVRRGVLEIVAWRDPLASHLQSHLVSELPCVVLGDAFCFGYDYLDLPSLLVLGRVDDVVRLVVAVSHLVADGVVVSLPSGAAALLASNLTNLDRSPPWSFRWTNRPIHPGNAGTTRWLEASEMSEVDALLDDAYPDALVRPGGRHGRRWAGTRAPDGTLAACAADCTESDDVGFIGAITTHPRFRGEGFGGTVTAWLANALIAEHGRVGLWHYDANLAASRLYDRLGFRDVHRMRDGTLLARKDMPIEP